MTNEWSIAGAGLQYGLPGTWNGLRKRGMAPEDLTRLWSTHAAKLAGMQHRKGALAAGMDADIVVRPVVQLASPQQCLA